MKTTGIVRKIDGLGRVVIPAEIRRVQGWEIGESMEMFVDGENFVMRSYQGNTENEVARRLKALTEECANLDEQAVLRSAVQLLEKGLSK